ncbi:MAG: hypothetical protein O3A10_13145 [Chloroflexi bacterium]|nr:hypothetical protein [Chloroflexota bacterium]MDA1147255.1 hypothetical protein [Chloroflexota bacterium]
MKLRTRGSSRLLIGVVPDGTSGGAEDELRRKLLDEVVAAGMRPGAPASPKSTRSCVEWQRNGNIHAK